MSRASRATVCATGGLLQDPMLLPTRGRNRLHLLRFLIDRLISREAGVLAGWHLGLDGSIDMRIQEILLRRASMLGSSYAH